MNPYQAYFEIEQGRVVNNLAIFADGYHLTYPGWASKDSDGKARVTVVSGFRNSEEGLRDGAVFITFSAATSDGGEAEGEDSDMFLLEPCVFDPETKKHVVNTEPRSFEDTSIKPFLCIDGEERDENDAIKLTKGDYTAKVYKAVYGAFDSKQISYFGRNWVFVLWFEPIIVFKVLSIRCLSIRSL